MGRATYYFRIDVFTPATLPMGRLAEYMSDLAVLFGEPERVHFERLEEGSAVLVQTVEEQAVPAVERRLQSVAHGNAPDDAQKAYNEIDRRLAEDEAIGELASGNGAQLVLFPGRSRPKALAFGGFRQQCSLDGILVRLGGKDRTVHATLQAADRVWHCETTREMARQLRNHLFEGPIRVHGEGRWRRGSDGTWSVQGFRISHFEPLDNAGWPEAMARLRAIEGMGWRDTADPLRELMELRGDSNDPH